MDLAVVDPPLDLDAPPGICSRAVETELGGTLKPVCTAKGCEPTLLYVAPNTLRVSPVGFHVPTDLVETLREAIATGRAHEDGMTEVGGRPVKRIRVDPPPSCRGCDPHYAYVDPENFNPVELHGPTIDGIRFDVRFLTYEYLPRTEANLALTDIRAQHPNATETGPFGP
jgi:hypothetical protein